MNAPKFTPGSWAVDDAEDGFIRIEDRDCSTVATLHDPLARELGHMGEIRANARLIAAAPELYEALDRLVNSVNPESTGWSEAVAALAKAVTP